MIAPATSLEFSQQFYPVLILIEHEHFRRQRSFFGLYIHIFGATENFQKFIQRNTEFSVFVRRNDEIAEVFHILRQSDGAPSRGRREYFKKFFCLRGHLGSIVDVSSFVIKCGPDPADVFIFAVFELHEIIIKIDSYI